jgi:hypothetical protein
MDPLEGIVAFAGVVDGGSLSAAAWLVERRAACRWRGSFTPSDVRRYHAESRVASRGVYKAFHAWLGSGNDHLPTVVEECRLGPRPHRKGPTVFFDCGQIGSRILRSNENPTEASSRATKTTR